MRNLLSLVLGMISFLCLFLSVNSLLSFLSTRLNLWSALVYIMYIIANRYVFKLPVLGVISLQSRRWPLLILYAFQVLSMIGFMIITFLYQGFSLLALIVYGQIITLAFFSFLKCLLGGLSYSDELRSLVRRAEDCDWSASEFLEEKALLDASYKATIPIGLAIHVASIIFCVIVLRIFY